MCACVEGGRGCMGVAVTVKGQDETSDHHTCDYQCIISELYV